MTIQNHPLLYQMNVRLVLRELSHRIHRQANLDDLPDELLDEFVNQGFEWIYLLGVWQTGQAALKVSRTLPGLQDEYRQILDDFTEQDVRGSCFAITDYSTHVDLGGNEALIRLRARLAKRGLRLMLDFVPNHTAPDHPWIHSHPEYYISGTLEDLTQEPHNFTQITTIHGPTVFAFGRDPYFSGWADTLQIDYSNHQAVLAMQVELLKAAEFCDGLRCDMAMLVLPEIFQRTWGRKAVSFWPESIDKVKLTHPNFVFMAEVYWDMESTLLKLGFDYTYDKRLYDRLRDLSAPSIREHLRAHPSYLRQMVHFLENHDELRAAAVFSPDIHPAAAITAFFTPGIRFFHQGQLEGRKIKISIHLDRGPHETNDLELSTFYQELLRTLRMPIFSSGEWQLIECYIPDSDLHPTLLAYTWTRPGMDQALVIINYGFHAARGIAHISGVTPGSAIYPISGLQKIQNNRPALIIYDDRIFIDLPAWGYCIYGIATN